MKLLHLADLHLGRCLLEESLIIEQKYILDEVIKIVSENHVDVVLICGDVYDKSIPSIEAVRLFSQFLTSLYHMHVKVLVIAGNHDSKDRLSFGNELFVDNGVYIEGIFDGSLKCVTLDDEYGDVNIYMLPFVKPADVRMYYPDDDIQSYDDAIKCIINHSNIDVKKRNIIMVHQFVTASGIEVKRTESETISLGGIDNVDVSNFYQFDYVAMGHVHGAQKLIRDTIRYAGSPLKYSFSEVFQNKSLPLIEFKEKGNIHLELIPLTPLHDMRRIRGKFNDLIRKDVISLGDVNDYMYVILTDEDYILDAIGKLRDVYPNVLKIDYDNARVNGIESFDDSVIGDISKKSEMDIFLEFYMNQNHIPLDDERIKILDGVIKEIKDSE